jgi:hypothetical protein
MSLAHWSDFHAWRVSPEAMRAAQLALTPDAYAALFQSAESTGPDGAGHVIPREAIEDAALSMHPAAGIEFLGAVYQVKTADGARLLTAIRTVRA